jgi:hypothetical protein
MVAVVGGARRGVEAHPQRNPCNFRCFALDFVGFRRGWWRNSQRFLCVPTNADKKYLRMDFQPIHWERPNVVSRPAAQVIPPNPWLPRRHLFPPMGAAPFFLTGDIA